jgi:hypothetical protein
MSQGLNNRSGADLGPLRGRTTMTMERAQSDDGKELIACPKLTRRGLLEFAGLAVVAAVLPPPMDVSATSSARRSSQQKVSSIMEALSTYMSEAVGRPLPDEVARWFQALSYRPGVWHFSLLVHTAVRRSPP